MIDESLTIFRFQIDGILTDEMSAKGFGERIMGPEVSWDYQISALQHKGSPNEAD